MGYALHLTKPNESRVFCHFYHDVLISHRKKIIPLHIQEDIQPRMSSIDLVFGMSLSRRPYVRTHTHTHTHTHTYTNKQTNTKACCV